MKKFAVGILGLFILLGGMFMTACGKTVSLSVSTQEVVVYTNDSQEENYQSKEIEASVENSKLGIGVEILDGQDCIDIEKTNTSTKKANGKYGFLIKTKENKNSGTAKVKVWSIEDDSKNKVIDITVNTVLEHLVAASDDSEDDRTNLYVVKGIEKNLVPKEFFDFSPITANVDELVWTFEETGTQTFSVDGQVRATIDGSTLLVLNAYSMDEIKLRASFVRNSTISEVVSLKVIETSTIKDFVVDDKEFYADGISYISGATVALKRNDSNNSRVEGIATVNTTYPMSFSLIVTDTDTKQVLNEEEYEKYFVFDITSSEFKTDTTTYRFYIDALDTTDEKVYGKFMLQFKFSYNDYNFDVVPSNINLTLDVSYTATRVDIYNESKNMINNSSIDVFSSYVSSYGYKIQPIVQPETIKIDNNMFHIAIDVNQPALVGELPASNPIDSLAKFYYHGTYLKFRQESNTSSVFISENISSGSEVYITAVRTFENVRMSVQSAANNTISSDIFVYLYQITSDDDLSITVTHDGEEVLGDTYLSSIQGAEREITFEAQIDGISTIAGLSLKSGKLVDGEYVENDKFAFSSLEILESNNSTDDKFVKVRFVASLTAFNFTDETSFWFEHVTNKMSSRYVIKAFVPITSASILSTEASSDIYINRNANQGFVVDGNNLVLDDEHTNASVSKLMVEAGATLTLSTEYRNATLNGNGVSFKFLNYKDMIEIPDLEGLGIDPEEVFENADLEKFTQIYSYFDDVNPALFNISQTKLIVGDSAFKGFVCVLFGGYNENHEETTFVRIFAIESFYSVRYLSANAKTKLLYTVETLSQTDMSRSYVDVTIEMRPDTKIPTYSNLMDNLRFASANAVLDGSNEIGYQNDYYQISAITFSNGGRYIKFRVTAYSTNLQTYFKDSLIVSYTDGNGREKTEEIQLEIRNVKRIESVEWVNQTYSSEIYLNLTSSYQSDKNFTVSTSVLPSDANDVGLTYQYYAVSGAATDLDVTVNTIGQTFNVNISTTVGGYGYLYLLPNDMIKVVEGTRKLLLYKYTEDEYGKIVDETANYSIGLSQLNERYTDIVNGTSEIDPFFLNNDGEKIYYRDVILKIYVVIADGRSSETAIRIYSQADLENIDTALYYKLMNDINLVGWNTIDRFSGEIDGQGHTLSFSEGSYTFVQNLSGSLKNINITGTIVGGAESYVGGIAAYVEERGLIDGCSIDVSYNNSTNVYDGAKLLADSTITSYVGWIAGRNEGTISNTYIYGASIVSNADYTGGFVGWNNGKIVDCGYEFYKAGVGETQNSISVTSKFGGFVGRAGATSVVERSYLYTYVDENIVTGPSPKAFAGSVAGGATFSECFAYLYDVKALFEAESADAVNVSNCYLTYDNEGVINVDVYLPGQSAVTLHSTTDVVSGADTTKWQTTEIDAGVNFGFMHLLNVQENTKVDPSLLALNETKNSLPTADDKKGILVVYKPTVSIVNEAEKSELANYNTISIQDLFNLAGENLTERQARSLLLTSTNRNITFSARNIRILSATQAEFEIVVRSKMDATLTSVFRFIVANKVPKLVTMVDGYQLRDAYMVMLQTAKSKNVIYSTSSTVSLNGNVYNLEKDQYQIDDVTEDENVAVSKNSSIIALTGLAAHLGETYTTLETKMSVGSVADVYKDVLTLRRNINITVYNGATAFSVRNASGLVVNASQAATFEAYMTSDDENDNLSISLGYGQIVIESDTNSDSEANFEVDGKLSLNVVWSKTLVSEKQYKFVVTMRVDRSKMHLIDQVYEDLKLFVKPTSQRDNDEYTKTIDFAVDVQGLEDLSMNVYRIDGRLVRNSVLYLTRANELLTTLTPSSDAIVAVMVDPAYAQMTHFNLTYSASGTGSLGTISITKLAYNRDYGYYTNVSNSTIITNGLRVSLTDEDKQGQGVYYFRIYASSSFTGEATVQFNATFFNGNQALLSSMHSMTISSLQEATVKVNGASTYLLAKGESATVTVTVGANQSMYNLYLQNSGANITLGDVTMTNYGSYIEYTATLYAGVDAELNTGSESGVFYVCATVERIVNGVQEIKVSRAAVCLVDFGIDTAQTRVGNSGNKASYNGKEYDAVYTYVNSENEFYFDYTLLPEEYVYDKSDSVAEAKVAEMMRKRNLFLNNYYYMDENAGYYINCTYNENRGIYEAVTLQEQLWFANDESHYSAAYNKNYNEFAQNDYFNLSMSNQGNLIITGKRTGSQLMMLRTRVVYQGIEFVRDYFFLVVVDVWTDEDAPSTISSAEEFIEKATNGEKAADYVLTNDIVLKDYDPIKNTELFNSFDGNGYTIHIESFKLPADSSTVRLALFDTVSSNTTLKNVKVNIYNGGQITLNVDQYKTIYVAGFAVSNYGVIYNSEVVSYYNSAYQTTRLSGDTGLVVSYTKGAGMDSIEMTSLMDVESHVSGFVCENDAEGSIVNSRVGGKEVAHFTSINGTTYLEHIKLDTFVVTGQGEVSGFVGQNDGYISASFVKNVQINNNMNSNASITAGFALYNSNSIQNSYIEGVGGSVDEYGDLLPVCNLSSIKAKGIVAGFVYTNSKLIKNAYSNIKIDSSSYSAAGFVYINQAEGTISICYSACEVSKDHIGQMQFSGVNAFEESLNAGKLELCYYYDDDRTNNSNEAKLGTGAIAINDVFDIETFYGYSFASAEGAYNGVWEMTSAGVSIVSANQIAISNRYVRNVGTTAQTTVIYNTSVRDIDTYELYQISYGSLHNPIIIRSAEEFAKATGKAADKEISSYKNWYTDTEVKGNYRIVYNLDMAEIGQEEDDLKAVRLQTTRKTFSGILDGNGFTITNVSLGSQKTLDSFGLFAKLDGAVIMNLDILVSSVHDSEAKVVGTFAGIAVDSRLLAISLAPVATAETGAAHTAVQGNNIVGGVVGILTGDSYMSDITVSSVDVESAYYDINKNVVSNKGKIEKLRGDISSVDFKQGVEKLSYAGGVVGFVDIYREFSDSFMSYSAYKTTEFNVVSIKVTDSVDIYGEVAGGLFGYVGKNTMVYDASITLDANMSKTNPSYIISKNLFAGGIVGENYGALHAVYARHSEKLQKEIEENAHSYYNGTYGAQRGQQTIFSYQSDDRGYTSRTNNPMFVGGIVGYMGGGFIYVAYNKLNVISYSTETKAVGGIVGLLGRTSNSYETSFLTVEKITNYLFCDVYASGDVYVAGGVSGGIIGQIAGIEDKDGKVAQTPSIVMKDVMAVNYYSIDLDSKKLSGESYEGSYDATEKTYTSTNHFTLIGGIYNGATNNAKLELNSNIYLISNYNDVYLDIYNGQLNTTAGDITVGGFNKLTVGDLTVNLDFFGFNVHDNAKKNILNARHLGESDFADMSYAYSRMYAYFIARGWETKYWNHKQNTLYPEIELLPKLSIMFWDWYNTDEVLQAMKNSSVTVVVRGKTEEKSDVIKDIDLRKNSEIWKIAPTSEEYLVNTFRGRLYSYSKYMNSVEGGQITSEIKDGSNNVGGKVGDVAGIILDKSLFGTITGSVIVDGVSFYFEESSTPDGVESSTPDGVNFAHVIEDSIVRNCQFVVNKNLTLKTKTEKIDDGKTIYATGLIADVARSTSIINNQILFRQVKTNDNEKHVDINFMVDDDKDQSVHYAGLFVGLMQQDSQFANITLQNCFFDEYDRKLEDETNVKFNFIITYNKATDHEYKATDHEFAFGTLVGKMAKKGGAKFGAEMIQFYHDINISYTGKSDTSEESASLGAYFGEVSSLSAIEYVVPDKKPVNINEKTINVTVNNAKKLNAGLFVGLIDNMSGGIAGNAATELLGAITVAGKSYSTNYIGGLVGEINACSNFNISRVSFRIDTNLNGESLNTAFGGVVGWIESSKVVISNCNLILGTATLEAETKNLYVGGMVGYAKNSTAEIATTQASAKNAMDFNIKNATNVWFGGLVGDFVGESSENRLSIGESGELLSYGLVESEKLAMTDENKTSTGKVEYTNVGTFTFGGAVGQTNSSADVNIKNFVYRGFVKAKFYTKNLTAGGIVGRLGVGNGNSTTISNNVSYGDVFVKYVNDDDQLSKYAFGGIVGEIKLDADGDKNQNIIVQDNYALMTNFNTRTTYKGKNKDYYVGALIGKNAESAMLEDNFYSSGVCLAYQEEDGCIDLPYTDQTKYYGYMKTASVNDFKPQTKGILSEISGSIGEVVGQSLGTKLNPLGITDLSDYKNDDTVKRTNDILWVSVNADMTLSQQIVTGDALENTAIVGNGHTITRNTNETSGATLEAGFVGKLGDSNNKDKYQFISNLIFALELEEDTTKTTYGGVVGIMEGNSMLYAVGATGNLSIGGTVEINLGGLVGTMKGGFVDNCYVDLDIIYRAKSESAGNTSAIANIDSGFSTVAETFALGMITEYTGSTDDTVHVYTFTNINSSAKASLYDNYTLMQYDDSKIVVGNASATPLFMPDGTTIYENNNDSGLIAEEIRFGADTDAKSKVVSVVGASSALVHSWVAEEYINYGYLTQPFGFMRLSQIKVYNRTPNVIDVEDVPTVHKDSYTYTPVAYENNELNIDITSQYFGMLNVTKFNEMIKQACPTEATASVNGSAYKYVLRYDIDGNKITETEINSDILDTNFELEAGSHTISGYNNTKGLFKSFAGKIENLRMTGVDLEPENPTAGILVDTLKSTATLKSIVVEGQITNDNAEIVGGVVGEVESDGENKATLQLIESIVNIDNSKSGITGGVVGKMAGGELSYASSNGIISNTASNGTVSDLTVKVRSRGDDAGDYSSQSPQSLASISGGVVGHQAGGTISNVYNTNSVLGNFTGTAIVSAVAGGIVGYHAGGTIDSAYNTGLVGAGNYNVTEEISVAGGIFGYSSVDTSKNDSNKVTNCMNDAAVQALSKVDKDSQAINIHKYGENEGEEDGTLLGDLSISAQNNPQSILMIVESTYNKSTNFKEVYAYGVGYAADEGVSNTNKTSVDNIKNDGNIGKYSQTTQILFDRYMILNNDEKFVKDEERRSGKNGNSYSSTASESGSSTSIFSSDYSFYASFKFGQQESGKTGYTYSPTAKDSYGFTTRFTMSDTVYDRYYYEKNDIKLRYKRPTVEEGWGWGSFRGGSARIDMAVNESKNGSISYDPGTNTFNNVSYAFYGTWATQHDQTAYRQEGDWSNFDRGYKLTQESELSYQSSGVIEGYDSLLAKLNTEEEQGQIIESSDEIDANIQSIQNHFESADKQASTVTVNGKGLSIVKTGIQFQASMAPNKYNVTKAFTIPKDATNVHFDIVGGFSYVSDRTTSVVSLDDENDVYTVNYMLYYLSDKPSTETVTIHAYYDRTENIELTLSNVSSDRKTVWLEDENGKILNSSSLITLLNNGGSDGATIYEANCYSFDFVNGSTIEKYNGTLSYDASKNSAKVQFQKALPANLNGTKLRITYQYTATEPADATVKFTSSSKTTQNIDFDWIDSSTTKYFVGYRSIDLQEAEYQTTAIYDNKTLYLNNLLSAINVKLGRSSPNEVSHFVGGPDNGTKFTYKNGSWSAKIASHYQSYVTFDSTNSTVTYDASIGSGAGLFYTNWQVYIDRLTSDLTEEEKENIIGDQTKTYGAVKVTVSDITLTESASSVDATQTDTALGENFNKLKVTYDIDQARTKLEAISYGYGYVLYNNNVLQKIGATTKENLIIYEPSGLEYNYNPGDNFSITYDRTTSNQNVRTEVAQNSDIIIYTGTTDEDRLEIATISHGFFTDSTIYQQIGIANKAYVSTTYIQNFENADLYTFYVFDDGKGAMVEYSEGRRTSDPEEEIYLWLEGKLYEVTINSPENVTKTQITNKTFNELFMSHKYASIGDREYDTKLVAYSVGSTIAFAVNELSTIYTDNASTYVDGVNNEVLYTNIHTGDTSKTYGGTVSNVSCDSELVQITDKKIELKTNSYNNNTFKVNLEYDSIATVTIGENLSNGNVEAKYTMVGADIYMSSGSNQKNPMNVITGAGHVIKFIGNATTPSFFTSNSESEGIKNEIKNAIFIASESLRAKTSASDVALVVTTNSGILKNLKVYGSIRNISNRSSGTYASITTKITSPTGAISNLNSSVGIVGLAGTETYKDVLYKLVEIKNSDIQQINDVVISGDAANGKDGQNNTSTGREGAVGGVVSHLITWIDANGEPSSAGTMKFYRSGVNGKYGSSGDGKHGYISTYQQSNTSDVTLSPDKYLIGFDEDDMGGAQFIKVKPYVVKAIAAGALLTRDGNSGQAKEGSQNTREVNYERYSGYSGLKPFGRIYAKENRYITDSVEYSGDNLWYQRFNDNNVIIFGALNKNTTLQTMAATVWNGERLYENGLEVESDVFAWKNHIVNTAALKNVVSSLPSYKIYYSCYERFKWRRHIFGGTNDGQRIGYNVVIHAYYEDINNTDYAS